MAYSKDYDDFIFPFENRFAGSSYILLTGFPPNIQAVKIVITYVAEFIPIPSSLKFCHIEYASSSPTTTDLLRALF